MNNMVQSDSYITGGLLKQLIKFNGAKVIFGFNIDLAKRHENLSYNRNHMAKLQAFSASIQLYTFGSHRF